MISTLRLWLTCFIVIKSLSVHFLMKRTVFSEVASEQSEREDLDKNYERDIVNFADQIYFSFDAERLLRWVKEKSLINQIHGMVGLESLAKSDDIEDIKAIIKENAAPFLIAAIRQNKHPYLVIAAYNILEEISRQDCEYFVKPDHIAFLFQTIKQLETKNTNNQFHIEIMSKIIQILGNMADSNNRLFMFIKRVHHLVIRLLKQYPAQFLLQQAGYHTLILMCKTSFSVPYEEIHPILEFLLLRLLSNQNIALKEDFIQATIIKVRDYCENKQFNQIYIKDPAFYSKLVKILARKNHSDSKKMVENIYTIFSKKMDKNAQIISKLIKSGVLDQIALTIQRQLFLPSSPCFKIIQKILFCICLSNRAHSHAFIENQQLTRIILQRIRNNTDKNFSLQIIPIFAYLEASALPQVAYKYYAKNKMIEYYLLLLSFANNSSKIIVRLLTHLYNVLKLGDEQAKENNVLRHQFNEKNGVLILRRILCHKNEQINELASRTLLLFADSVPSA